MGTIIYSTSDKPIYQSDRNSIYDAVTDAVSAGINLSGAKLSGADMSGANLPGANLFDAELYYTDLSGANLSGANLYNSTLHYANLSGANLFGANLCNSDLYRADLSVANLSDAKLAGAKLYGAKLSDALNYDYAVAQTRILPEGDLIVWKKCAYGRLVKLRIPAEAKRSNGTGRKCRAEYAEVLSITDMNGQPVDKAVSSHDPAFTYTPGSTVRPTRPFDEDMWTECSSGIHFYITMEEAENNP